MSKMITVSEAKELWDREFPVSLSRQTILNWCKKYEIGKKNSPLRTSKFLIDEGKFKKLIKKYK
jgi:hypothetical protein